MFFCRNPSLLSRNYVLWIHPFMSYQFIFKIMGELFFLSICTCLGLLWTKCCNLLHRFIKVMIQEVVTENLMKVLRLIEIQLKFFQFLLKKASKSGLLCKKVAFYLNLIQNLNKIQIKCHFFTQKSIFWGFFEQKLEKFYLPQKFH